MSTYILSHAGEAGSPLKAAARASTKAWGGSGTPTIYIVASHLRRGSVVTVAVGQINGGLSDCGPYPIQMHLIDTRILDLEWAATIYLHASGVGSPVSPSQGWCHEMGATLSLYCIDK